MATNQTSSGNNVNSNAAPAQWIRKHRTLVLVLAIIIPPLGLALAIYWFYRYAGSRRIRYIASALVIALVSIFVFFVYRQAYIYWYNHHTYLRQYTNFETFKVPGAQQDGIHDGVTFQKPQQFERIPDNNPATKDTTATLVNYQDNVHRTTLAAISLSVSTTTKKGAGTLNTTLSNASGTFYQSFKNDLTQYLKSALGTKNDIDLKTPTTLRTPNIASDAWQFDFNINNTDSAYKQGQNVGKGKILLIFGNKTSYYFIINSVPFNWNHNQDTWQQVINSIKIDQQ